MRILIVEDETIPANYLKNVLQGEGYEVIAIAKSGEEAIELSKVKKPDIILMDIMLQGGISGADASVRIHHLNPNIIIIFLTAFLEEEILDFAIRSEAFAYLLKPYREKEIIATLKLAQAKLNHTIEKESEYIDLVDNYRYHKKSKRLFLGNQEVKLGPKALQLIQLLCYNKNISLEIDKIIEYLWDSSTPQQTLRSLIHRVRQLTSTRLIQNTNKFGYKIGLKLD